MRHVTRRQGLLITFLPLLLLIPALTAKCAGPAYAQAIEQPVERDITPVAEPPGVNLDMALMFHVPLVEQEKEYRKRFDLVMGMVQSSSEPHPKKQPVFAMLTNASKAAEAKDFEGATALVKVAEAAAKKLK
jgi:hypothetical protein